VRPIGVVHVHSSYSHDSRDSLADLHAFGVARGLSFIALTDHAEDFDAATFARFVVECRALSTARPTLIPGLEFRFAGFKGMHLLALGLQHWIDPETPEEFVAMTRQVAGLTIAAHPVLPRYTYPSIVLENIDAIEIWNAAYNTRFLPDPRAIRLLQQIRRTRPEVVGVAGLDQHDARNDRETRVEMFELSEDPISGLRTGRFGNIGRTMRLNAHADLGIPSTAALWGLRAILDVAERLQDRAARGLANWRK
jgi:hypothetical protein